MEADNAPPTNRYKIWISRELIYLHSCCSYYEAALAGLSEFEAITQRAGSADAATSTSGFARSPTAPTSIIAEYAWLWNLLAYICERAMRAACELIA
jgi:hypothetical protein